MDCVMSHQAGVANTVAVSGTALTGQQLTMIKRLCTTIICSFDTDAAGESATKRSLALASQFEFERLVIKIPSGKDPADTVHENPDAWTRVVREAKPVVEFYFEKIFREQEVVTAGGKKTISAALLPLLAEIGNEVEKAHWIGELSRRLGIPEAAIVKELDRKKHGDQYADSSFDTSHNSAPQPKPRTRREMLEERYLGLLSTMSEEERLREAENQDMVFTLPDHQELFRILTAPAIASATEGKSELAAELPAASSVELLRFKNEIMGESTRTTSPKEEFLLCKLELRKSSLKERLQQLTADIQRTEKTGDRAITTSLLQDFRTISETLKSLSV